MAFHKLNTSQLLSGIILPVLFLGALLGGYLLILPRYQDLQAQKADLQSKRDFFQQRSAQLQSVQEMVGELETKRQALTVLDEALPMAPRIPELLANLDALAKQSGLLIDNLQITPAPTLAELASGQEVTKVLRLEKLLASTKNLGVMQLNIKLLGLYPNLKIFLQNLEQNLRLMDADSIVISQTGENSSAHEYVLRVQTYYQKP